MQPLRRLWGVLASATTVWSTLLRRRGEEEVLRHAAISRWWAWLLDRERRSKVVAGACLAAIVVTVPTIALAKTSRQASTPTVAPAAACTVSGSSGLCSPPQWFPLRGKWVMGCTWNQHNSFCGVYHCPDLCPAVDIARDSQGSVSGDPVYAAGAGLATVYQTSSVCGSTVSTPSNVVEVNHGGYLTSWYYHLSKVNISGPTWVNENTVIGFVGHTGDVQPCTFNHLHFEVRQGTAQNPLGSRIDPGQLLTCVGPTLTTFPGVGTDWPQLGLWTHVENDGTGCLLSGHVVKVQGDTQDAWLISPSDGKRDWIPNGGTYNCLAKSGDPVTLSVSTATTQYPINYGVWATCPGQTPFEGSIVRETDKKSFVIVGGQRHFVPDYLTDLCSQYVDHRPESFPGQSFTPQQIQTIPAGSNYACNLNQSILTATDQGNPEPSYAIYNNQRHWIPDGPTYSWLTKHNFTRVVQMPNAAILGIADGGTEPKRIDPPNNSIVQETPLQTNVTPVSLVFSNGVFYKIADYATNLCALYVRGLTVSLTNVDPKAVVASYPISGSAYSCSLENAVLRGMDKPDPKPSYAFHNGAAHPIPDKWTYSYLLKHGFTEHDVPKDAWIQALPVGASEPPELDPSDIQTKSIVEASNGSNWTVGTDHARHLIPFQRDLVCWKDLNNYPVVATNLTPSQANQVGPQTTPAPCIIGNRVVRSDDGSSWFVDTSNTRYKIPDTDTYYWYAYRYPVTPTQWPAADVAQLLLGPPVAHQVDPTLSIGKNGSGSGTVSGGGINCGATCSVQFHNNSTTVTLTATADSGSAFWGWSGACSGQQATCTLTLGDNASVTATFVASYTIRSLGNGLYISAELQYTGNDSGLLRARTSSPSTWEKFTFFGDCSTGCAIVSLANHKYVSARFDQTNPSNAKGELRAEWTTQSGWETFKIVGNWSVSCTIQSMAKDQGYPYVSTEVVDPQPYTGRLRARSSTVGGWERYQIVRG